MQRISSAVRLGRGDDLLTPSGRPGEGTAVAPPSSWTTTGTLERAILADVYGTALIPTRLTAMQVPALVKGRALVAGTLSRYPLRAYRGDTEVPRQPAWLSRTDTTQPPQWRMMWTLDDLIWYGRSLWVVRRGAGSPGPILDAIRVPFDEWEVDDDLRILVQGQPANAADVIYFDGPQDGLLDIAREDISASLAMTRAWTKRVKTPVPLMELHDTDEGAPLEDDEVAELVGTWETARQNGGTAYTPSRIETKERGTTPTDLFVQGRNAARIDFANYLNLPVGILDGSPATASLTYSGKGEDRNELVDLSLSFWTGPIAARLSMDDVTPRGTRIDFDITWLSTPPATANPASED